MSLLLMFEPTVAVALSIAAHKCSSENIALETGPTAIGWYIVMGVLPKIEPIAIECDCQAFEFCSWNS